MTDTAHTAAHGAAIRAARESCSPPIRRGELAERLGIGHSTLAEMESGAIRCPLSRAVRIADYIATRSGRPSWQVLLGIAYPDGGDA